MTPKEVGQLISEIEKLDYKFGLATPEKAKAWVRVLNPHMSIDIALEFVVQHYGRSEKTLMPSDLNAWFRGERNREPLEVLKASPKEPPNWEKRKRQIADLKAKIALDKGKPYKVVKYDIHPGMSVARSSDGHIPLMNPNDQCECGLKWEFEIGSGGYSSQMVTGEGTTGIQELLHDAFKTPEDWI